MPDVVAIGEALIDFIPTIPGKGLANTPAFEKRPGGAPANVAVGVSRLGGKSGFIGKLGRDEFGEFLKKTLEENGVDLSAVVFTSEAKTGLAFVTLKENGEREFIFYRRPCADILLEPAEINKAFISSSSIFHFGTVSLIEQPAASATYHAVSMARKAGKLISLDVNLREPLWPSLETARKEIMKSLQLAHLVKVSEEELYFITEIKENIDAAAENILKMGPSVVLVTLGAGGCYIKTRKYGIKVMGFEVKAVDTTGAGDAFTAGILTRLVEENVTSPQELETVSQEKMVDLCRFANAAGALTCTKKGAISALPARTDVEDALKRLS
ncbi:MAG: carbohydrate kinase [Desulfotomaculum sp.]|nr:carbohydrate kinase [Desulfotomaculum sp.]